MPHVSRVPSTINWVDFVSTDPGGAAVGVAGRPAHRRRRGPGAGRDDLVGGEHPRLRGLPALVRRGVRLVGRAPEGPGVNYALWKLDGRTVGGMLEMTPEWEGIPSAWMTYFAVTDTDGAAERAGELGGSVGAPPFDTAFGRIAVLVDPAGGHFSVVTPTQPAAG